MINRINISFGSKTLIETLNDEKNAVTRNHFSYQQTIKDFDYFINNLEKNPELSQIKINRRIGAGSASIVYETEDGDVVKLTRSSHYPLFRDSEDFDVPIKKRGKAGKIHYYIEEKLFQHNLHNGLVKIVKEQIRKKGYKTFDIGDFDIQQIGMSKDGKLYLLDPECARFKTIFHAIFHKLGKIMFSKIK